MSPLAILVLALATWQAVEIWRHSTLFVGERAYWQSREDSWLGRMLSCPWCLSVWVAAVLVLWYLSTEPVSVISTVTKELLQLPINALAISRLANLANDLTHPLCRTPGRVPPE